MAFCVCVSDRAGRELGGGGGGGAQRTEGGGCGRGHAPSRSSQHY